MGCWGLTSGCGLLDLLAHQRRRQVDGEGERRLLGVLDDDAGLADVLRHHVLLLRGLRGTHQKTVRFRIFGCTSSS